MTAIFETRNDFIHLIGSGFAFAKFAASAQRRSCSRRAACTSGVSVTGSMTIFGRLSV